MRLVLALLGLSLIAVGTAVVWRPMTGSAALAAPALEAPADGATLLQNNTLDCTVYGHAWEFRWSAVPDAARYELRIAHQGAPLPVYSALWATESHRVVARCGCLPETMLDGWTWQVRAVGGDGQPGAWSAERGFRVERFAGCGSLQPEQ